MAEKIIKMTPMQKYNAKIMRETVVNNPQATSLFDADMGPLFALKKKYTESGEKYTVTTFLVKVLALAMKKSPDLNSRFVNNEIHVYDEINIGVATATHKGLIVPVIKNADLKTLKQITEEISSFRERFQKNKITIDDLQGGTVTISSLSSGRCDAMLPILNNNECLIIGVPRTKKIPVVLEDGKIVVKDIAKISVAINHCITYGTPSVAFANDFAEIIENIENYM